MAPKLPKLQRRFWVGDASALVALTIIAWLAGGFLLRDDVFIYGDHPGQYWRMWYTLNIAWPLHHRLIDWVPHWYAGYPELQFYPPGFVLVAWLLNLSTFGQVSTALSYQIILFVAFTLPGLTFYYAVRHLGFERRAAFAAGVFGLVFPAYLAGAQAVFVGMIGSRLAFALNALVLVWTIDFIESRGRRYIWAAALTLAGVILAHPYHAVGILIALVLYVLVRRMALIHLAARLAAVTLFAVALDAFWLVPLLARSPHELSTIVSATLDPTWRLITDVSLVPYALPALLALARARREKDAVRRCVLIVLIALPFLIASVMLGDHLGLMERLHIYRLDAARLIGEYYLPLLLVAAIGVSEIGAWFSEISLFRKIPRAIPAWGVTLAEGAFALIPFLQSSIYFHPGENTEPRFLTQASADYRLDELWETLRGEQGRVLFTSFYTQLNGRGNEAIPTTLPALTPLFTRRQLMGGTFTHWSPIAALMWSGKINPPMLWGRIEGQDDRALFGVPLEELSAEQLFAYCQRFNITTIVASVNDYHTRIFLDASPRFQSYYNNGFFFAYRAKDYESAWFDARNAAVELAAWGDDQIDLRVRAAQADASVTVKVYAYPLWRARTDTRESLAITRDEMGLMRILLPRGADYSVTLRYEEGGAEQLGNWISVLSLTVFGAGTAVAISRRFITG